MQASAPGVRDMMEKGVADAVTFPWGSILLFGIDKVTKYHMDVPLYVTTFAWVMNKAKYERMSPAQRKVIDDHCTTAWAVKRREPMGRIRACRHPEAQGEPATRSMQSPTSSSPSGARRPSRGAEWAEGGRKPAAIPTRSDGPQGGAGEVQIGILSRARLLRALDRRTAANLRRRCLQCGAGE